jgi:hypothetical protein
MVFCLRNTPDIDAIDCDEIISFVNRKGNEYHNKDWWGNLNELTEDFKAKALKMVHEHNLHNGAVAINGCKKDASDRCQRVYSRNEAMPETYLNQMTDRIIYQCLHGHYNVWYNQTLQ